MVLDADVIIRYLTNDDEKKAKRFESFLKSGKTVHLTDVTVAEVYWTLSSYYQFPKEKIVGVLEALINNGAIKCNLSVWQKTLDLVLRENISLIDAYCAAETIINGDGKIMSFDKGFDKLEEVTKVEP